MASEWLTAYAWLSAIMFLVSYWRGNMARSAFRSYEDFCTTLGMTALWPITLAIELIGTLRTWLWGREQAHIRKVLEDLENGE